MLGLLEHKGLTGEALQIALAYEHSQWGELLKTNLAPEVIQNNYLEAIRRATDAAKSIAS